MPKKKSAKKAAAKPAKGGMSKTAWVLSQPPTTSAKEMVAKAKQAGMTISEAYVHTIRSNANRKKGGGPTGRSRGRKPNAGLTRSSSNGSHAIDGSLVRMVIDHGAHNIKAALQRVIDRLESVR